MDIHSNQVAELLVQKGKYGAEEKLDFLKRYWETGQSGLPEEDKLDHVRRNNITKWEREALAGGRRDLQERMRRFADQVPALTASLAKDPYVGEWLPMLLVKEARAGAFRKFVEVSGLPTPAAAEAMKLFREGMLDALIYTGDKGEVPSVKAICRIPGPFPRTCLDGISSAACLFVCAQHGRQDVIHIYNAGIAEVTLVDLDGPTMEDMKRIYRPDWKYEVADYKKFLSSAIAAKVQYDLVTADPYLDLADEVVGPRLRELVSISRKTLCLPYTTNLLEKDGYKSGGLEQMSRSISERAGRRLNAVEVMHRNETVYWAVIRIE